MNLLFALFPLFLLILALIYLDSFKLIKIKYAVIFFILGILAASVSFHLNNFVKEEFLISDTFFIFYNGPVIEELIKLSILIILFRFAISGFIIDSLIYGFIIGSGFGFLENIYYSITIHDTNLMIHIVRGFGTAIMHGTTIGLSAALFSFFKDKKINRINSLIICIFSAILIHSLYNEFFLSPVIQTVLLVILFIMVVNYIFSQNEKDIHNWIINELDTEIDTIMLLESGNLSQTNIGKYINEIKHRFTNYVIFDMLCLVKLNTELSMQLKVNMMLKSHGLEIPKDEELQDKLIEYQNLVKSIGKTGISALNPILQSDTKTIWKLSQLK
jgi:RsiW-degrading membrane proteinase PrsW (M82 family)